MMRPDYPERSLRILIRDVQPDLFHECREIAAPAYRDRRGSEQILQDQVPPDDPGDELAERCVTVGVGASGDRNHRRKFGVAEAGEETAYSGQDERVNDSRPGVLRCRGAGKDENSCANDGADAERCKVERTKRAPQRSLLPLPTRFSLKQRDALPRPKSHVIPSTSSCTRWHAREQTRRHPGSCVAQSRALPATTCSYCLSTTVNGRPALVASLPIST